MTGGLSTRLQALRSALPVTPTLALPHDRVDLHVKLESCNLTGSAKDRSAYWILDAAVRRGEIDEQTTIIESSSGNFALAMATFSRVLGLDFIPIIDPNINASTERLLRASCRRVEKVTVRDRHGGYLLSRLARVQELRETMPHAYWPNQYANSDARAAHYELTGAELCTVLPNIDYLFIGVGTGATLAGLADRVREHSPHVTVVAVDAEGSVIFGGPPRRRLVPGIGSSIQPELIRTARIDDVMLISERDTISACHRLVSRYGLIAGGSTGSVYAAIEKYFAHWDGTRPTVAFLCADRGHAYAETIYDPAWVTARFGDRPGSPTTSTALRATGTQA